MRFLGNAERFPARFLPGSKSEGALNYQESIFQKSLINVNANHAEMRGKRPDHSAAERVKFIPSAWERLRGNGTEAIHGFYQVIYSLMKRIERAFIHIIIKTT